MQSLEIKTAIQIQKPVSEVYEAIVNPQQMKNYFIADGIGRLDKVNVARWTWVEFDGEYEVCPQGCEKDKYISFRWDGAKGLETVVEMFLEPIGNDTKVTVTEKSAENNDQGIQWLKSNTEGWANFLANLKAWLEYGINLRKGAFEYMRVNTQ